MDWTIVTEFQESGLRVVSPFNRSRVQACGDCLELDVLCPDRHHFSIKVEWAEHYHRYPYRAGAAAKEPK